MKIIKRNGAEVPFDITKIITAVTKASDSVGGQSRLTREQITQIAAAVTDQCQALNRAVSVEEVQDMVENQIMNAFANGEGSRAEIVNVGRLVIVGSQQDASLTSNGVYGFAIHGGNVSVQNEALGHFAIEGGVAPGIYYVAEGLHGSDTVVFENAGQMTVTGGEAAGIYLVAHNSAYLKPRSVERLMVFATPVEPLMTRPGAFNGIRFPKMNRNNS